MKISGGASLSVIALGSVPDAALQPLRQTGLAVELRSTDAASTMDLATEGRGLNVHIDAAVSDWVLLLRENEAVTASLAAELRAAVDAEKAWGYRLVRQDYYRGRPLAAASATGEIRLFHRRRARFVADAGAREMLVQGTVIRLRHPLCVQRYASVGDHMDQLLARKRRRPLPFHLAAFVAAAPRAALGGGTNAVVFAWVESRFE